MFSGDKKIQTRGLIVPVENEALPSFPLNSGPEGWVRYHDLTVQHCVISADDVTEVDVYSQ